MQSSLRPLPALKCYQPDRELALTLASHHSDLPPVPSLPRDQEVFLETLTLCAKHYHQVAYS